MGKKMSREEIVEEYKWLTRNGMSQLMACRMLGYKPQTVARYLYIFGEPVLASRLENDFKHEVRWSA